ncbi:MOSC domain-containing protein [Eleftheria terrae]|nr:MOSC domain-containing protein [Eleftheria terrae]WKB54754.1 MOSC domain-containing protein [Eleftheria terrae]
MTITSCIQQLRIGSLAPLPGHAGVPSGIGKQPVAGPCWISADGLRGDHQGDRQHHGGTEKAVHHYPLEHYPAWQAAYPEAACHFQPGAFGENLVAAGWTEASVCIGDVFEMGEALLQVSQARQPCWRLNARFGLPGLAAEVQASGRTGWYYRVLRVGWAEAGTALRLLERPHTAWPLARLHRLLYVDRKDRDGLAAMAALPALSARWRQLAQRRLDSGQVEDMSRRLQPPPA